MSKQKLINLLISPHVTEKTMKSLGSSAVYSFAVASYAGKDDIKHAVELMFNAKVDSVNVLNVKGKGKRFAQVEGRTKDWKKAYVTLKSGEQIDFSSFQA